MPAAIDTKSFSSDKKGFKSDKTCLAAISTGYHQLKQSVWYKTQNFKQDLDHAYANW